VLHLIPTPPLHHLFDPTPASLSLCSRQIRARVSAGVREPAFEELSLMKVGEAEESKEGSWILGLWPS
jgi:hypothetical protein